LAGGELIGPPGPAQRRENVELPTLQLVRGECGAPGQIQATSQSSDPREHEKRLHIQMREFASPRCHDSVDIVRRAGPARIRSSRAHLTHDTQCIESVKSLDFERLRTSVETGVMGTMVPRLSYAGV